MKTAVSIPDDVCGEADRAAEQLGWSRSQLYTRALRDFLERQGEDSVTSALNVLADELVQEDAPNAARAQIDRGDWEW